MATFLPDAKTLKVVVSTTDNDGHVDQSRFFLAYAGTAPTDAELEVMAVAAETSVVTNLMPLMREDKTSDGVTITDLTSDTSAQGEYTSGTDGSLTGGYLPASTSLVVSQTTGRRFRGGHSRVYLPVGDDTKISSDALWTSVFAGDVAVAWSGVVADTAGGAWAGAGTITAVMASFYLGFTNEVYGAPPKYRRVPTPRAAAVNYAITGYVGRLAIGTQRRRLRIG
jgi:hypothetical protein